MHPFCISCLPADIEFDPKLSALVCRTCNRVTRYTVNPGSDEHRTVAPASMSRSQLAEIRERGQAIRERDAAADEVDADQFRRSLLRLAERLGESETTPG